MIAVKLTEDQALQDAAYPIEVKVYDNGSQAVPTAATVAVYDGGGGALLAATAMTVATDGTLTYSLASTLTSELTENGVLEVVYTYETVARTVRFFFDIVIQKLELAVTDDDLKGYFPTIGDEMWADEATYAGQIGEAFQTVKRLIKDRGKRPAMLIDGSQVRELVIIKAFEMVFFAFAKSAEDVWWARFLQYQALFKDRFAGLVIKYDEDESGTVDTDEQATFAQPRLER